MVTESLVFRDLAYVFAAAVLGGGLAWLARQPLILGYVLGGILVSPLTPGPSVSDLHTFELFAEVGVVLLMFSIGIEFSLRDLLRVKWVALLGGPLGILALGRAWAWPSAGRSGGRRCRALVVGLVVSVASTMVMARLLIDRGELHSRHGRVMIGITLVEDLAVVVLIVLMPALATLATERLQARRHRPRQGRSPSWSVRAASPPRCLPPLILAGRAHAQPRAVPPRRAGRRPRHGRAHPGGRAVARARRLPRRPPPQRVRLRARDAGPAAAAPGRLRRALLRDARRPHGPARRLVDNLPLAGRHHRARRRRQLVLRTGVVHPVRLPALDRNPGRASGSRRSASSRSSSSRSRAAAGHVGRDVYNATLAASLLTILVNAALVRRRRAGSRAGVAATATGAPGAPPRRGRGHVVLCGFGRVGSAVGEALETFGVRYAAIETDPDIVTGAAGAPVSCLYGDAAHRQLLEARRRRPGPAGRRDAPGGRPDAPRRCAHPPAQPDGVRSSPAPTGAMRGEALRAAGATVVVQPEVEAAARLIRHALERLAAAGRRVDRLSRAVPRTR